MKIKQFPFYLIAVAIFLIMVSPTMFSDGMFMDGLWYAAIAKNLANGVGGLWDLQLSKTIYTHFIEHPPFAFWLQAIFFWMFGESFLIERFYSLFMILVTAWAISLIWKNVSGKKYSRFGWLPILFWVSIPLVSWSAANNMLENTMAVFICLSVLFTIKSLKAKRFAFLAISGLMLFLALLTKGFVALFPLSLPFWIYLFNKNKAFKEMFISTFVLIIFTVMPLLFIFVFSQEGATSLFHYFNKQVVGSINNVQTVDSRFFIVSRLFQELLPALALVLIALGFTFKKKITDPSSKWVFIFLSLGFSGVIPIMISLKQSGFYIVAAFPFFGIALAMLTVPRAAILLNKLSAEGWTYRAIKAVGFLLVFVGILIPVLRTDKIVRDKDKLSDIYKTIKVVSKNTTISIDPSLRTDWSLHGYFIRYGSVSLDFKNLNHKFLLVGKGANQEYLQNYGKMPIELQEFDLYKRNDTTE